MPRGDGTGPMGSGPMTGRAAGWCGGFAAPGFMGRGGYGGFGRGFCRSFGAAVLPGWGVYGNAAYNRANEAPYAERAFLNSRAELLENQLEQIKSRLNSLDEEGK